MTEAKKEALLLKMEQQEATAAVLYERFAARVRDKKESETLTEMSVEERHHAAVFGKYAQKTVKPFPVVIWIYMAVFYLFGYTFTIRFFEKNEEKAQRLYRENSDLIPEMREFLEQEDRHENELIAFLDEERLKHVGDMVLGMNDALVELTGSLAGYTLALHNTKTIAMAGLITGISATLSMMSSSYLSTRAGGSEDSVKSALYTGGAYLLSVALLILPYLLLPPSGYVSALILALLITVVIIAVFNFYISVAKGSTFHRDFLTMAGISLGVAAISFAVGLLVKNILGIDM